MKRGFVISFMILITLVGCVPQKDAKKKTVTPDNFSQYFDWNISCQIAKTNDIDQERGTILDVTTIFWPKEIYAFSSVKITYQINMPTIDDKVGILHVEEELLLHKNESTIQTYSKALTEEQMSFVTEPTIKILSVSGELMSGRYPSQLMGAHNELDKYTLTQKLKLLQNHSSSQRVHIESRVDIYKRDWYNEMDVEKDKNHYIIDNQTEYVKIDNEALYLLDGDYMIDVNHQLYQTSEFVFQSYQNYIRDWLDLYFNTKSLGNVIYQDDSYISTNMMSNQDLNDLKQWNNLCRRLEVPPYDYQDFLCTRKYHFTEKGVEVHFNVNLHKNHGIYNKAIIDIVAYIDFSVPIINK
ncbi:MAG: hypothetical protein NC090_00550 [Anaeroplasma bactoclasticum]|nr:hypothetical protein [Anaeroplasma bactoclasticum]